MNFIFISPNFPDIYSHFVKALKERGITVLGIGDTPYDKLNNELKENLTEYCFCSNLANIDWMKNTVSYLKNKYGPIDYLESNNEFWLENDAELREYANVLNGLGPKDMEVIKYKSKMKAGFIKAGVKVARYILVDTLENSEKFIEEVGYPVFAKPDNGVGAAATYKISNHDELVNFHNTKPNVIYIMEEFLNGYITSFDGIANDESEVVLVFNETFPTPIAEVVHTGSDVYYYANMDMPKSFREMGERVIKAFGIKKRCFHIEFFCLLEDKKGLGKKGDIIALETNMRSPGGNTPDLLCIAFNNSYYEVYADVIAYDKTNKKLDDKHYIAIAVSRRNNFFYKYNDDQIKWDYKDYIVTYGHYSPAIAPAMG
ncbi:MAG: ATP-grasp domain-containing protein, partial [Bacilli bacterium]|nr:ATP-grasp domain-containing protein [Bacilli bacterium]